MYQVPRDRKGRRLTAMSLSATAAKRELATAVARTSDADLAIQRAGAWAANEDVVRCIEKKGEAEAMIDSAIAACYAAIEALEGLRETAKNVGVRKGKA